MVEILFLATHFQFVSRADLWKTAPGSKHMPVPAFGARTRLPRPSLDSLWSAVTFGRLPAGDGPASGQSSGDPYRLATINILVSSVNAHREVPVTSGDTVCDDESVFKSYGLGRTLIFVELPLCVAIDHKPENSC